MKKAIAALVLLLTVVFGGRASAQMYPVDTVSVWMCSTYLLGWYYEGPDLVQSGSDPGWSSWPYSYQCAYLYTCTTTFENGVYSTVCA